MYGVVMGQSVMVAEKSRVEAKQVEDQKLASLISLLCASLFGLNARKNSWWRVSFLVALVDEVVKQRRDIDPQRLYVAGFSMRDYRIWRFVSHWPDHFAVVIPINGGGIH